MSTLSDRREPRRGLTLERAVLVALVLHLVAGLLVDRWPGLLVPASAAADEAPPLRFQFVDTPAPEAEEPPETDVMSDIDRRAADASERDDRDAPRLDGDTLAAVVRPPGAEPAPTTTPSEPTPPLTETPAEPEADPEERAEPAERPAEEPPPETTSEAEPAESTPRPAVASRPRRDLQRSLSRMEAFVDPRLHDNPDGGAPGQQNLAQFDTRGYDLGAYLRDVLRRIEGHWRSNMPPLFRSGVGGATFIALSIRREATADGREIAIIVAEQQWTSGQPAYDTAARFSLELSTPLPPIPQFYPYDAISGRLGYIYNLDPDEVRFPEER